jgi:hypothetical protein
MHLNDKWPKGLCAVCPGRPKMHVSPALKPGGNCGIHGGIALCAY